MTAQQLRNKYLNFFRSKGHTIIHSASLVPENDPTTLFTTAGMHPLVPYIMGEEHPGGNRIANVQKCIRTTDIDEVGDATHHTFFEMLGNWSFGNYFKKEAIEWSWEFLTSKEWLGLDKNRLAVSVFEGDKDAPFDQESYDKWVELGISEKRIAKLPKENNWWGPAGETGPCGPDTEMFYWVGDSKKVPDSFNDDNDLWVEIWNDVFMEYEKTKDGKFKTLKQKNVDTGMGLERMLTVINRLDDNYRTELFWPIIEKIEEISGKKYGESEEIIKSMRIIADHINAAVMIIGDGKGIVPSNADQGYIVRRLIRRAIRYGKMISIENNFTKELAKVVLNIYEKVYLELGINKDRIVGELEKEEEKFRKTLDKGLREFEKVFARRVKEGEEPMSVDQAKADGIENSAFYLFETYGFPVELTIEEAKKRKISIDEKKLRKKFDDDLNKHQELSRTASAGKFKGGLADSKEETKKLHTVAHLMLAALRQVLGNHVEQKGSNITAERLRFDFSHGEKMTPEQIAEVENLVNGAIEAKMDVIVEEMTLERAKQENAVGVFDAKYGERVKVYDISDDYYRLASKEICGGPHVENTGELGKFRIVKEQSSGAGVRRIKAVLE